MKIVFLVGSLEPGRDGVGDYTMRLSTELVRKGHQIGILALNDQHAEMELEDVYQTEENKEISFLRLPSKWLSGKRFKKSKEWIENFNPDWISLQFVIFAFHPKGLPFGLAKKLLTLGKGKPWHIMFHELWVGMDAHATKKNILWGWLQRKLIKNLIFELKPLLIHTQSRLYQAQLTRLGLTIGYLPLFGNIPNSNCNHSLDKVSRHMESEKTVRLIHFALIHQGAPIEEFARELTKYSRELNLQVVLTLVGRSGPEQIKWVNAFQSQGFPVETLGERPAAYISELFTQSSLGISSTPVALIEKSGSIAAMQEHGLPIICVSFPWIAPAKMPLTPVSGVFEFRNGTLKELLTAKKKYYTISNVGSVARELENSFYSILKN